MRAPRDVQPPTDILGPIGRLKRRADFLRVAKGKRWHAGSMTVQAALVSDDSEAARVGYTLTRKVGSAVVRNRVRRRLKEAVRLAPDLPLKRGHDYVIVGRVEALRLPFATLTHELDRALRAVHEAGRSGRAKDKRPARQGPSRIKPAP